MMKIVFILLVTYFMAAGPLMPAASAEVRSSSTQDKKEKKEERKQQKQEKEEQKKQAQKPGKVKIIPKTGVTSTTLMKTLSKEPGKFTGEKGDFIFYDADLQNVLLFFAKQYKLNMVIDPGIKGTVTCRMIQVPWDQALDVILRQHGLTMVVEGAVSQAAKLKK